MNRLAVVLTIVFVTIVTSENSSSEEQGENKFNDLIACKNETGASDIDMGRVIIRANPITQTGKCLTACYLDKLGIMTQEKFEPENILSYLDDVTLVGSNGKTLDKVVKEIADECKAIFDTDKCESAAKILNCLNASAKKRGFCPNVF
ncbi:general odorant-binding protein 28a-like [Bradysia coprophila]|uniref:general odorant-binding protein 28a-like n=1 Tax=Bradysia coprophila TaxID=38358 RepID=UPI00187D83DE|nr:general odorant-binding protein 28a-like [Bradysia coprophila]